MLPQCLPYIVEVAKSSKLLKLVPVVQIESCSVVLNDVEVHSSAQLMLCKCNDTLYQLACNTKVAVLVCYTQCQNVYHGFLIQQPACGTGMIRSSSFTA